MGRVFDFYGNVLHYGNRQDYEILGGEWRSWEATLSDQGGSIIEVTDEDGVILEEYQVIWVRTK